MQAFAPVTHGVLVRSRTAGQCRFTETVHPPGLRLPKHGHADAAITLVVSGAFDESHGRTVQRCEPLSVLYKPAGMEHRNDYGTAPSRSFIIELDDVEVASLAPFAFLDREISFHGPSLAAARALGAYRDFHGDAADLPLAADHLLFELLAPDASRSTATHPRDLLDRVRDRLLGELGAPPRLTALAVESGLHPVYLARIFRARYGCSMSTFVRRERVRRALHAVTSAERREPLPQLALRLGFTDQAHLTRAFRRETGWSPARFARRVRATIE